MSKNQYAMQDPLAQYPHPKFKDQPQSVGREMRINAVAPGPFWTLLQLSGEQPATNIPEFGEEVPMKRPGQPAECAPIYVLLASQEASFVIGEVYGATGGNPIS
jgi:NAD(P)-dependent dehydrogenase (short-subunit alcohol dehydrogenase family)